MKYFWGKLSIAGLISILAISGLNPIAASAAEPTGDMCTITGTAGNDVITGTSGDDVICGLGGDDVINGGSGNDVIVGGPGDDTINGQDGNDTAYGDDGADEIFGGTGDDTLNGGVGEDDLFGDAGLDVLNGDADIDGLNGGADKDTLNGGDGNDVCVDFTSDTYSRSDCRVDKTAPAISHIVIDPAYVNVDSSNDNGYLGFTFDMVDHGSGVQYVNIYFQPIAKAARAANAAFYATVSSSSCTSISNCLVSGTPQKGHYHALVRLPGNLVQGSIVIAGISTLDRLYNQKVYNRNQIVSGGLDAPFTQTGTPDLTAPVVSNFSFVGSDHNLDSESEYAFARATFSDVHKLQALIVNFSASEAGRFGYQEVFDSSAFQSCGVTHLAYTPCLVSGDQSAGVLEFPIHLNVVPQTLQQYYKPQSLVPVSYEIRDNMQNVKVNRFTSADAAALTVYKAYKNPLPTDDRDTKAPVLKSLKTSTSTVSNLTGDATFTVTARITDKGVGLNRYARGEVNVSASPIEGSPIECHQQGNATGKPTDATFIFDCTIPQFANTGKWSIALDFADMSQRRNQVTVTTAQLAAKRFPSYVTNQ